MIDRSSGGSIAGMIAAADRTLSIVDASTRIIPGHGSMTDRQGLQEYRDMLAEAQSRIGKLKQQGKTLDEVVAAKPTADLDAKWGKVAWRPDFFVTLVYTTLYCGKHSACCARRTGSETQGPSTALRSGRDDKAAQD